MRIVHLACLLVGLLFLQPVAVRAQELKPKRAITVADYFTQADLFEVACSGDFVVYSEGRWQESTNDRKTDLWIVNKGSGAPRRLTSDQANDRSPQFADGIFFLGNRKHEGEKGPPYDGTTQVWRLQGDFGNYKGPPEPVTRVKGGIDAYRVVDEPPYDSLFYLVHAEKIEDDWSGLRAQHGHLEYGHGQNRVGHIWKLDFKTWRAEKIIDAGRHIHEFAVSRNGKKIAMITSPDDKVVSFEGKSRVDVWDATTGKITTIPDDVYRKKMPSPYAWLEKLAWSPTGDVLAFGAIFDGYPAEIVIANLQGSTPSVFRMQRPPGTHVRGYGSPLKWADSKGNGWRGGTEELMFLAEHKGRVRLCAAVNAHKEQAPELRVLTPGDVVVESFDSSVSHGITTAVIMATPTQLAEVYWGVEDWREKKTKAAGFRQLTNVNPQAAAWKLPQLSVVSWKGAGGQTVEGILELPADYKQGDKVPLVVEIHGGPTTATYFKQQFWIYGRTLLPAQGYAVLCPNYRGSTGYGDKFTTDLIGRENDIEVEDILKGVDAMIERGIADPDKLAVTGWSNGGYLTNCIITKTTRFKAAISGAGIVDAIMEWGANDEPAYAMVFKQGLPWTNPEKYHKASSTYQLGNIRTPTLIHVGANDDRCPPGHSKMLYRALKEYVKVPTELIVYPGEGHGISKYRNRKAKLEWDLAWLERHLMGKK